MRGGVAPPYDEALFYPFTTLLALVPSGELPLGAAAAFLRRIRERARVPYHARRAVARPMFS